jgi:hypothetical protein
MLPLTVAPRTVVELDSLEMEWCESGSEWPKDAVSATSDVSRNVSSQHPPDDRKDLPE